MPLAPCFDVSCLALPPSLRQKLVEAGYTTITALRGFSPVELAKGERNSPADGRDSDAAYKSASNIVQYSSINYLREIFDYRAWS